MDSTIDPEFLTQCVAALHKQKSLGVPAFSLTPLKAPATDEPASPQGTTASLRLPLYDAETKHYYHGLPTKSVLVVRMGTDTWKLPTVPFFTRKRSLD